MAHRKLYKAQSMKIGLGLLAIALVLTYASGFAAGVLGERMLIYLLLPALTGISGFAFLVLSAFLPRDRKERPTFTQELLGRERLQYGVYTDGNWMSVLDKKAKDEKKRHHHE